MESQRQDGYVFSIIVIIITLIITLLSIAIADQKNRINLIEHYQILNIIEEEVSAVELVILEYLNLQYINSSDFSLNTNFQKIYETPSNAKIKVELKVNDNCFNINSLFYRDSNNNLEINYSEFNRLQYAFKKLNINNDLINSIIDWIDKDTAITERIDEINIYEKNNLSWRPRNNFAVSNLELSMIPGFLDNYEKLNEVLCVNLYNRKINLYNLKPKSISLFFPFLNEKNAQEISEIIKQDVWPNSDPGIKTNKNIKNFQKEVESLIGRALSFSDKMHLKNINFISKSIEARIEYISNKGEKYISFCKFEVDSDILVKLIYRYGPFKEKYIDI